MARGLLRVSLSFCKDVFRLPEKYGHKIFICYRRDTTKLIGIMSRESVLIESNR